MLKKRPSAASPLAAAAVAVLALSGAPQPQSAGLVPHAIAEARADEAPKIFHGVGIVTGIDAASGTLTIDHGDIPGFMDAMEMAYKVRPATLTNRLQKGDKIAFGVDGTSYTIVEIQKVAAP